MKKLRRKGRIRKEKALRKTTVKKALSNSTDEKVSLGKTDKLLFK